ncbi:MAG TPA: PQQ-binding-like beta-propeller repeat protein [Ignavibacteria bacterium]
MSLRFFSSALLGLFLGLPLGIIIFSCSGVKVSQEIVLAEGDWLMAGGSPEQKNVSYFELAPPLQKMWDYDIEGGVGYNGIAVADAVVFVNSLAGEMISIDVTSGGKIGSLGFLGKDAGTTPLVLGNDIIIAYAGDDKYSVASYNLREGKRNWRKNFRYIQTSPVLQDGYVYFGSLDGNQYKIEAATGRQIWKYFISELIHSTCAVSNGKVLFGTDKGSFCCIGTTDGSELWKIKIDAPVFSTPLIYDERVYFGADDSNYYAVNIMDGSIAWKQNMKTKITGGSTIYGKSSLIFGGINGNVYALNINDGELLWNFHTNGTITSSPVTSGRFIYCTSFDSHVYCLNGENGTMVWVSELQNKSRTTPVVWKDYLFVAADRTIYCFTNKEIEIKKQ